MTRTLLLALLSLTAACACNAQRHVVDVDGTERNYFLHVPDDVDDPAPLVLVFHGGGPGGANKGRTTARFTGFDDLADEHGFVVAAPSSYQGNWDDGRDTPHMPPEHVDDVAFVDAVIEDVAGQVAIDRSRIYATGVSNGGFFTERLACERTDTFAAVAPVIGTMAAPLDCAPTAPLPTMFILGTDDPAVPYEGGEVAGGDRGEGVSAAEATAFWAHTNGCGDPVDTELPDIDPDDGTRVLRREWTACHDDAGVVLLEVQGGGHTWPGGTQYLPEAWIGPVSHDIDAEREIWAFFEDYQR